jgi:hypothetical protein
MTFDIMLIPTSDANLSIEPLQSYCETRANLQRLNPNNETAYYNPQTGVDARFNLRGYEAQDGMCSAVHLRRRCPRPGWRAIPRLSPPSSGHADQTARGHPQGG